MLKTSYKAQPAAPGVPFDPVTDGISFVIQGAGPDIGFAVAPGDLTWVQTGAKSTWSGTFGTIGVTVVADSQRRAVSVTGTGFTFEAPSLSRPPVRIAFVSGQHYAGRTFSFRFSGTTFRAP